MLWLPAVVGALLVGGSLGRTLSDVTGLDKTSPPIKYHITGVRDEQGHWTEEVKMEHGDENWHVEVDHTTLEEEQGQPKVKITATFSDKTKTSYAKEVVEADRVSTKEKEWVFQLYPMSHRDWFGAEVECEEWGGHLAIPDTREKLSELTRMLETYISESGETTAAFLGYTDLVEEGNFVTVLGKPLFGSIYSTWSPLWFRSDQPDDDKSWSKDGEDCGSLRPSGGLNDVPCRYKLPFICEKDQRTEMAVVEEEISSLPETGDEDDGSLRLFPLSEKNWYDARKDCFEYGGFLAIPDSEAKMKKMKHILNSPMKNPDKLGAFLGFSDIKEEGKFVTIFGKPLINSKNNWSPQWSTATQPDNNKDWTTDGEDCGSIRPDGGLDDVPCRYHLPYFCEMNDQVVISEEAISQMTNDDYPAVYGIIMDDNQEDGDLNVDVEDDGTLRLFSRSDLDWFEAKDACKDWGGSLAVPDTREKVEEMSLKLKSARVEAAFLGFGDQEKEGHFITISGAQLFDPSSWSPSWFRANQPDDDKEWSKEGEDCGSIRSGGGLNDVPCKYHMPYFCEKSLPIKDACDQDDILTIVNTSPPTSDEELVVLDSYDKPSKEEEALHIDIASLATIADDESIVLESDKSSKEEEALDIDNTSLTTTADDRLT